MPTAAVVNVSLRARHEQFTADMDKAAEGAKRWQRRTEESGRGVRQTMESVAGSAGNAARSFGQVATGAILMATNLDNASDAGRVAQQTFGAFLAGGPLAAGVVALSSAFELLGQSSRKAHEAAIKAAAEHEAAIGRIAEATKRAQEAASGNLTSLEASRTGEDPAAIAARKQYETDVKAANAQIADAKLKRSELRRELDRVQNQEIGTRSILGIPTGAVRQQAKDVEVLETALKQQEELLLTHYARMAAIDEAYNTGVMARAQKLVDAQNATMEKAQADAEKRYADAKARADEVAAEGSAKFDRQEEARRGADLAKQEEARLSRISDTNAEIADRMREQAKVAEQIVDAKQRQFDVEKAIADAAKTKTALDRAMANLDRVNESEAGGGSKGGAGGPATVGEGGGEGQWYTGGAYGGGYGMGPLAAAREAKRIGRQQRRWKNHADNQAASRRESLSYGTIEDGGMDPFAFDLGSVMAKYKPGRNAKPEQGAQTTTSIGSDASAAANEAVSEAAKANNIAQKAADAAKAAADSAKSAADTASKTATSAEDVASSSGSCADSLTTIDSGISAAATNLSNAAGKLVSIADRVKALEDAAATIQAAVGGQ